MKSLARAACSLLLVFQDFATINGRTELKIRQFMYGDVDDIQPAVGRGGCTGWRWLDWPDGCACSGFRPTKSAPCAASAVTICFRSAKSPMPQFSSERSVYNCTQAPQVFLPCWIAAFRAAGRCNDDAALAITVLQQAEFVAISGRLSGSVRKPLASTPRSDYARQTPVAGIRHRIL